MKIQFISDINGNYEYARFYFIPTLCWNNKGKKWALSFYWMTFALLIY